MPNANTANDIGIAYKEMKDYDAAIKYHNEAIKLDPNFGHAYYSLGLVYVLKKYDEQAIASFNEAIKLKYKIALSYYNLGSCTDASQTMRKRLRHTLGQ